MVKQTDRTPLVIKVSLPETFLDPRDRAVAVTAMATVMEGFQETAGPSVLLEYGGITGRRSVGAGDAWYILTVVLDAVTTGALQQIGASGIAAIKRLFLAIHASHEDGAEVWIEFESRVRHGDEDETKQSV